MPKQHHFLFLLFLLIINVSCSRYRTIKYNTYHISTVDNNVCKRLNGHVIMYAVFVDTRYTQPWSEYDIFSTLDSIKRAKYWLENLAKENGIKLTIDIKFHQNGKIIPILNNFSDKTLSGTLFSPRSMPLPLQLAITPPAAFGLDEFDFEAKVLGDHVFECARHRFIVERTGWLLAMG